MLNLYSADSGTSLSIIEIEDPLLAQKLGSYGIYKNGVVTKISTKDSEFATVKVNLHGVSRNIVGFFSQLIKIDVNGKEKFLYHLNEGDKGVVTKLRGSKKQQETLSKIGIEEGVQIAVQRYLPHMEYVLLVGKQKRVHLTEALVSLILGRCNSNDELIQFSFARKNREFEIESVVDEPKVSSYLKELGIKKGETILLEGIEPGKDVPFDETGNIFIYASEGYRLRISDETAKKILVM
jgi:Fe2+ transport system protein FeoA